MLLRAKWICLRNETGSLFVFHLTPQCFGVSSPLLPGCRVVGCFICPSRPPTSEARPSAPGYPCTPGCPLLLWLFHGIMNKCRINLHADPTGVRGQGEMVDTSGGERGGRAGGNEWGTFCTDFACGTLVFPHSFRGKQRKSMPNTHAHILHVRVWMSYKIA